MNPVARETETILLERGGKPAGKATVFCAEDGLFVWGWERPDGLRFTGAGYSDAQGANDALIEAVAGWYAGLQ